MIRFCIAIALCGQVAAGVVAQTTSHPDASPVSVTSIESSEADGHQGSHLDTGNVIGNEAAIAVKRLPWRVSRAVMDPESGSVIFMQEQSPELFVLRAADFDNEAPLRGVPINVTGQPHDIAVGRTENGAKFVVRTDQGELVCIDVASLGKSASIQLGAVSSRNRGILRVGRRSDLVYTSQSAGLNDPSVPTSLIAIDVSSDPPKKIDVRGSKRIAMAEQFSIVDNDNAIIALIDENHAVYFPLSTGTLGKPGENYLRVSSNSREINLKDRSNASEVAQIPMLSGSRKSGVSIGRDVWSADGKTARGTLRFQPTAVFDQAPWVAGIANLGIRIASLQTATTVGTTTLPIQMLRGLPHNDAIDEIGLPYAPISAIILPDRSRDRMLVIIGDHVAVVPLARMELPHVNEDALVVARNYDEVIDIEHFALSPDRSKVVTLSGNPKNALEQIVSVYDRESSKVVCSRSFSRKLLSIAAGNDAVYVVDIDSIPTRLTLDTLTPVEEIGFRCETLEMLDERHFLADGRRRYALDAPEPSGQAESAAPPSVSFVDRRLKDGWLIDGAFRVRDEETIGRVGILYEAGEFVSTPSPGRPFDYWNQAYAESPVQEIMARRTRESGTLLCPPVRCQSIPVQISVVQSEVDPTAVLETSERSKISVASPQVELTLEVRDLVDGRLVKQYPLLRERLDPSKIGAKLRVIDNIAFLLHRGTLIDVDFRDVEQEAFPRGPRIDPTSAPVVIPLQRRPSLSYKVLGGTPPLETFASVSSMSGGKEATRLVRSDGQDPDRDADANSDRTHTFTLELETWLSQNFRAIGKQFDELFRQSDSYDHHDDAVENLRKYMREREERIRTILGRAPKGIPVLIGIEIEAVDANEVSCKCWHHVAVELPVKALASQIKLAQETPSAVP